MTGRVIHVILEAHVLDIRRGLWCDTCQLPSVCSVEAERCAKAQTTRLHEQGAS